VKGVRYLRRTYRLVLASSGVPGAQVYWINSVAGVLCATLEQCAVK